MTSSSKHFADIKHVFVCGLPRSGTSLLGRNVARLEGCTGFKNTGVLEDEGQFLQDVYRSDHEMGGAGSFGFHPDAHLTEASPLLTPESGERLRRCWEPYWDKGKPIRVEKTPGNLLMTRFLQAVFPNSYFVVMKRHPVAVSMATQKWKDSVQSLDTLFQHWLHCHGLFDQDKKYLQHVYELRYEDYVNDSTRFHKEIAAFIGSRVPEPLADDGFRSVVAWRKPKGRRVPETNMEPTSGAHNEKYLDRWSKLMSTSAFTAYYRHLADKYEAQFSAYGYSLLSGLAGGQQRSTSRSSDAVGRLYCAAASLAAFSRRRFACSKEWMRINSKTVLPRPVVNRIRIARRRISPRRRSETIAST